MINTMHIPDKNGSPNLCTISTNAGLGRLTKPITIKQRSEINVNIKMSRQKHNAEMLVEPHENLFSKGLNAARCLVKSLLKEEYLNGSTFHLDYKTPPSPSKP